MATEKERLRKVESILITQEPSPNTRATYDRLVEKYNLRIHYRPFTEVKPISAKDFRRQRINLEDFTAVIFTSKNSIDHYFRICEENRHKVLEDTKYFCASEMIALYLQKHTVYRKRKVFHGPSNSLQDLKPILQKHRKKEKFLIPCSNTSKEQYAALFQDQELDLQFGVMYETVSADLSDLKDVFYDILVFFNLQSIESLYENFPDFKQNYTRLAAFGEPTVQALKGHNLIVDIPAPTPTAPSMSMAIEAYIKEVNALQSRE